MRPLDVRLVRNGVILVGVAFVILLLTVARTGALPRPQLAPAFDAEAATATAAGLAREFPTRVPGTSTAREAVASLRERLDLDRLGAREVVWREDLPGLGKVELRNLVVVVRGTSPETIVLVANHDNGGRPGSRDDAAAAAALLELSRAYARSGTTAARPVPLHTLVFLFADAGTYGSRGLRHFLRTTPLRDDVALVLALDGLGAAVPVRLDSTSAARRSTAPFIVRTARERISEETGRSPLRLGLADQLVSLALPYGEGAQAAALAEGVPAIRLGSFADSVAPANARPDLRRLPALGRASETLLQSFDSAISLRTPTAAFLHLDDRAIRGWALALLLVAGAVPFVLGTIDLVSRCRRLGIDLQRGRAAFTRRLAGWVAAVVAAFVAAFAAVLPGNGEPLLSAAGPLADLHWATFLAFPLVAVLVTALLTRGRVRATPDDASALADYTVAFAGLAACAVLTAIANPYALVFVLPSLYAWFWLPQLRDRPQWIADVLVGFGFAGLAFAIVGLGRIAGAGLDAPLFGIAMLTTRTVPLLQTAAFVLWLAAATQVVAVTAAERERRISRGEAPGAQTRRVQGPLRSRS
ncbi:MAG: M28 family peptidase [Gaiella sp.]